MRPVELSEPGRETNEMTTNRFDVDEELRRLNEVTDERQGSESEQTEELNDRSEKVTNQPDSEDSSESPGVLGRLISWIKS